MALIREVPGIGTYFRNITDARTIEYISNGLDLRIYGSGNEEISEFLTIDPEDEIEALTVNTALAFVDRIFMEKDSCILINAAYEELKRAYGDDVNDADHSMTTHIEAIGPNVLFVALEEDY